MDAEQLNVMRGLAEFFRDYGASAFMTLELLAIVVLWRAYRASERARFNLAYDIIPLIEQLTRLARQARKKKKYNDDITPVVPMRPP